MTGNVVPGVLISPDVSQVRYESEGTLGPGLSNHKETYRVQKTRLLSSVFTPGFGRPRYYPVSRPG